MELLKRCRMGILAEFTQEPKKYKKFGDIDRNLIFYYTHILIVFDKGGVYGR